MDSEAWVPNSIYHLKNSVLVYMISYIYIQAQEGMSEKKSFPFSSVMQKLHFSLLHIALAGQHLVTLQMRLGNMLVGVMSSGRSPA